MKINISFREKNNSFHEENSTLMPEKGDRAGFNGHILSCESP